MPITLTLPDGVEYVAASLLSTVFVMVGHNINVGKWRKRSGIKYPQLYAEKAEVEASRDALIFNCAQRAHANTLENIPVLYVTTLITAVKYPIVAATACGVWSLSRVFYTRGYLSGDPSRRTGAGFTIGTLGLLTLLLTSTYTVGQAIFSRL